jgi:hypothetical protein
MVVDIHLKDMTASVQCPSDHLILLEAFVQDEVQPQEENLDYRLRSDTQLIPRARDLTLFPKHANKIETGHRETWSERHLGCRVGERRKAYENGQEKSHRMILNRKRPVALRNVSLATATCL